MFSRISKLFIVCIMLTVIIGVQQVAAVEIEAGIWTQKADIPTARLWSGAAVVDGKIYVLGGRGCGDPSCSMVAVYDPATDTWTRKASMPTGRGRHAACVVDGRIYVLGGATRWDGGKWPCVQTVEVYDPATDTWTQASDMPWARMEHSASVVDGKIYIIGGQDPEVIRLWEEGKIEPDELEDLFSTVDVYDPAKDTWVTAADLPTPRGCLTAGIVDGKIYAIGGGQGNTLLSTVEEYDPGLPGAISSVSPAGKLLETWGQIKKAQ